MSGLGLLPSGRTPPGRHCAVLNYHYFYTRTATSYLEVAIDRLESQLKVLRDVFQPVGLKEAAIGLAREGVVQSTRPLVAVSIDDGCSSIELALPLFRKYEIPVTLFIPAGLCLANEKIDGLRSRCLRLFKELADPLKFAPAARGPAEFFTEVLSATEPTLRTWIESMEKLPSRPDPISSQTLLSEDRLRSLARTPLLTIAAHSMSHQSLAELPGEWQEWEIVKSLAYVREWGGDPEMFAYPYGNTRSFSGATAACLESAGVKCAFTTVAKRISGDAQPLALGRMSMFDKTGFHYVRGTAGGAFEMYPIA